MLSRPISNRSIPPYLELQRPADSDDEDEGCASEAPFHILIDRGFEPQRGLPLLALGDNLSVTMKFLTLTDIARLRQVSHGLDAMVGSAHPDHAFHGVFRQLQTALSNEAPAASRLSAFRAEFAEVIRNANSGVDLRRAFYSALGWNVVALATVSSLASGAASSEESVVQVVLGLMDALACVPATFSVAYTASCFTALRQSMRIDATMDDVQAAALAVDTARETRIEATIQWDAAMSQLRTHGFVTPHPADDAV